jgi:hypothetical protein
VESATQQDFWGEDSDPEFQRALQRGRLGELADVAGRRVLADPGDEAALVLLRDVLPADPPEDYDPRPYIEANEWTYARTRPQNPHEYLLLHKSTDWREHLRFLRWIRVHGEVERWLDRRDYPYRTVDGWRYWSLCLVNDEVIINRRKAPEGGE